MLRDQGDITLELTPVHGVAELCAYLGGVALAPDSSQARPDESLESFVEFGDFPGEKWQMVGFGGSVAVKHVIGESSVSVINVADAILHHTERPTKSLEQAADRTALEGRRLAFAAGKIDVESLTAAQRGSLLTENLESMADSMVLIHHMVPVKKRTIRDETAYQLTAIFTNEDDESNLDNFRRGYVADGGVVVQSEKTGSIIGIEDKFALGLVYHNLLLAVATGRVDDDGNLFIRQIQRATDTQMYPTRGFDNGFWWRDMLVRCWEEVAENIGCPAIVIQSHENSFWLAVREYGQKAYDEVAGRMHYDRLPNGNWMHKLGSNKGWR